MLCNSLSFYPDGGVDQLLFFQDNEIDQLPIIKHYDELIKKNQYSEADKYISQQEGIHGYFADFFNAIENRIYSLQSHLLNKEKTQQFIDGEDDSEPENPSLNTIWI